MLWSEGHKTHPVEGVRPGRKHLDLLRMSVDFKLHFGSFRSANPIRLGILEGLRPVNRLQTIEQALGIGGDAHTPLGHLFSNDRMSASFGYPIDNFIIGQNSS